MVLGSAHNVRRLDGVGYTTQVWRYSPIGVFSGCFGKNKLEMAIPGLPGGFIIYQGNPSISPQTIHPCTPPVAQLRGSAAPRRVGKDNNNNNNKKLLRTLLARGTTCLARCVPPSLGLAQVAERVRAVRQALQDLPGFVEADGLGSEVLGHAVALNDCGCQTNGSIFG